jgi:phage baseplate assembly protein W
VLINDVVRQVANHGEQSRQQPPDSERQLRVRAPVGELLRTWEPKRALDLVDERARTDYMNYSDSESAEIRSE